jgi:hypothetical protein
VLAVDSKAVFLNEASFGSEVTVDDEKLFRANFSPLFCTYFNPDAMALSL